MTVRPINTKWMMNRGEISMGKQLRDPEATRTALLDAAEKIFLSKGFGKTSLSEIAREAGMTKSLIHHYFGSKEGLWHEVQHRRYAAYIEQQMRMINDQPPTVDLLADSFRFHFHHLKHNPELVRLMAWIFLERNEKNCLLMEKQVLALGVEKLREVQNQGKLRKDIDPRFILFVLIGLAHHWFQDRDHFEMDFGTEGLPEGEALDEAYLENVSKIFFSGILPGKE